MKEVIIIMNIGAFIIILSMRRDNQSVEEINDLKGISKTHPFIAFSFIILMFSLKDCTQFNHNFSMQ